MSNPYVYFRTAPTLDELQECINAELSAIDPTETVDVSVLSTDNQYIALIIIHQHEGLAKDYKKWEYCEAKNCKHIGQQTYCERFCEAYKIIDFLFNNGYSIRR